MEKYIINNIEYEIIRLLGKGKGGYSYLAKDQNGNLVTLKQIHHEPCSYYTFGNKIEAEKNDYQRIKATGITIPEMIYIDEAQEVIIKEYIDGPTISELVINNQMKEDYLKQVRQMAETLKNQGLNIDYFPTNFIVSNDKLYYVDYECNSYMDEWNFENWGIKYWSKTKEFKEHFKVEE